VKLVQPAGVVDAELHGEVGPGRVDFLRTGGVGDRGGRLGAVDPIGDVLGREHLRSRHRDRPDTDAAEQGRVPLRYAREHHEHVVALAHAEVVQGSCCGAGGASEVSGGLQRHNFADAVEGEDRRIVRRGGSPRVDDVQDRVEAFRNLDTVVLTLGRVVDQARRRVTRRARMGHGHRCLYHKSPVDLEAMRR
jgi:hypothetical protein